MKNPATIRQITLAQRTQHGP